MLEQGRRAQARVGCPLSENCSAKVPKKWIPVPHEKPFMDTCHYGLAEETGLTKERTIAQGQSHSLLSISIQGRVLGMSPSQAMCSPLIHTGRDLAQVNPWMSEREDTNEI